MLSSLKQEWLCHCIIEELRALVESRTRGELAEADFVQRLLNFEEERLAQAGLILCASNTIDDWTIMKLRIEGEAEPCAELEFDPATGRFRDPGSGPRTLVRPR